MAGDVAARPREAFHQPRSDGIADGGHDDGDARRGRLRGARRVGAVGDDDVELRVHDLARRAGEPVDAVGDAALD